MIFKYLDSVTWASICPFAQSTASVRPVLQWEKQVSAGPSCCNKGQRKSTAVAHVYMGSC